MSLPDLGTKQAIDALKGTPMLLVLLILNVAILWMVGFLAFKRSEQFAAEKTELIKLLQECSKRPPTA